MQTNFSSAACAAGPGVSEILIACHVYSFACFLLSSLIASALKQAVKISDDGGKEQASILRVNISALRAGILVSGFGSVLGCGFLMMALIELVKIKLGTFGCRSLNSSAAICPLVVLVPFSLIIYLGLALYAFTS